MKRKKQEIGFSEITCKIQYSKMEIKYRNKYIIISLDKARKYIETVRTLLTENQTEEEYKADMLVWINIIKKEKPVYQLVDERNMRFVIAPEVQIWINKNVLAPAIKSGLRKIAFLVSEELFSQVSIEQAMEENTNSLLKVKYFDKKADAKKWLGIE